MEGAIVIALILACIDVVVPEPGLSRIEDFVAVRMASHIGLDVCLIVVQENRLGMMVV